MGLALHWVDLRRRGNQSHPLGNGHLPGSGTQSVFLAKEVLQKQKEP
jgi:hypothetical protein